MPFVLWTQIAIRDLIQEKYDELMSDRTYLNQVLADGKDRAQAVAAPTLAKVKKAMGFAS